MRFLNKYELQEPITGGAIKVYEATEPDTGLRRLVHIMQWTEMPGELTTLQILEQFRRAAPDPPGIILDAGRVEHEEQIYLVTSFPSDPLSVQRWINSCAAMSGPAVTPGTPKPVVPKTGVPAGEDSRPPTQARQEARASDSGRDQTVWTRHEPGAFTKEFLATLEKSHAIEPPPPKSPLAEPTKEPGEFTKEFLSLASTVEKDDGPNTGSRAPASGLFRNINPDSSTPAPPPAEPAVDAKTGEFTQFFRGYSGEAPEPTKAVFSPLADRSGGARQEGGKDGPGEFTKMFGKLDTDAPAETQPEPPATSLDLSPYKPPQPVHFEADAAFVPRQPRLGEPLGEKEFPNTRIQSVPDLGPFDQSNRASNSPRNAPPSFEPAWKGEAAQHMPTATPVVPQTPGSRIESQPSPGNSFVPSWKEEEPGTTRLMTPVSPQPPMAAPVPQGPSEFTRIISATSVPGGVAPPAPSPAGIPPVPIPAAPPQFPAMTAPPAAIPHPAIPTVPPAPAIPMYAPPAALPQPAAPKPAPKPLSYLPLIITMNVLLLVAIAVVLYFALRSHH